MRLLLLSLIILSSSFVIKAQLVSDEIRIYLWPDYISVAFEDRYGDENNARVRASVKISIMQKAEIAEIENLLLNQKSSLVPNDVTNFTCQMIVDFIEVVLFKNR